MLFLVLNPPAHAARDRDCLVFSVNLINRKFFGIKPKCENDKIPKRDKSYPVLVLKKQKMTQLDF